jgi:hypothetical protein
MKVRFIALALMVTVVCLASRTLNGSPEEPTSKTTSDTRIEQLLDRIEKLEARVEKLEKSSATVRIVPYTPGLRLHLKPTDPDRFFLISTDQMYRRFPAEIPVERK